MPEEENMVIGYFGLPGCGKSTFMAKIAQKAIKSGRYDKIFCNFYCDGTYKLNPDDLGRYDFSNCLILIDEITLFFDSRDFKKFTREQKEFFLMHRHYGVDIIYFTQQYDGVDKKIRDITQELYYLKRAGHASVARCIHRTLDVDDHTKQIVYGYELSKGLLGFVFSFFKKGEWQFCWRPLYYKYFDSFERVKLPKKEFIIWDKAKTVEVS